jgi:hypothetical protein
VIDPKPTRLEFEVFLAAAEQAPLNCEDCAGGRRMSAAQKL